MNLDTKSMIKGTLVNIVEVKEMEREGKITPAHQILQFMKTTKNGKIQPLNVKNTTGKIFPKEKIGQEVTISIEEGVYNNTIWKKLI